MEPFSIAFALYAAKQVDDYTNGWASDVAKGVLGNISDRLLSNGTKRALKILKTRQNDGSGNHDLMKALRRSMLEATLNIRVIMKDEKEEKAFRKRLQIWLEKQLAQIDDLDTWHDWNNPAISELELFFDEVDKYNERKLSLIQDMTSGWVKYLQSQESLSPLPESFTSKLCNGWKEDNKDITWWNLVMMIFKTSIRQGNTKESQLADKALVHNFLAELKLGLSEIGIQITQIQPQLAELKSLLIQEHPKGSEAIDEEWKNILTSIANANKKLAEIAKNQQDTIGNQQNTIQTLLEELNKLRSKYDVVINEKNHNKEYENNKYLEQISILEQKLKEYEEKEESQWINNSSSKTQFERKIQLKREIEEEKTKAEMSLGISALYTSCSFMLNQNDYLKVINEINQGLNLIHANVNIYQLDVLHEQYFALIFLLVNCYLKIKRYDKALQALENSYAFSKRILVTYKMVEHEKQYVIHCEYFYEVLKSSIESASLFSRASRISKAKNIYEEIKQTIRNRPLNDRTELHRLNILFGNFEQLIFKKQRIIMPQDDKGNSISNPDEIFSLVNTKIIESKYEEAFNLITFLIENEKKIGLFYLKRADICMLLGDYDHAIKDYSASFKFTNDINENLHARLWIAISKVYIHEGSNNFLAQLELTKIIEDRDDVPEAYYYRGVAYLRDTKTELACEDLKKALSLGWEPAKELLDCYCDKG